MEKDNLGTHRGLFQARLEVKKKKKKRSFLAFKEHSVDSELFNLILNMCNSSFYKTIRNYSACWFLVLSPGCRFSIICIFFTLAK